MKNWNRSPDLVGKKKNKFVDVGVWIALPVFVLNFISASLHFVLYISFTYEKFVILKKVMARKRSEKTGQWLRPTFSTSQATVLIQEFAGRTTLTKKKQ